MSDDQWIKDIIDDSDERERKESQKIEAELRRERKYDELAPRFFDNLRVNYITPAIKKFNDTRGQPVITVDPPDPRRIVATRHTIPTVRVTIEFIKAAHRLVCDIEVFRNGTIPESTSQRTLQVRTGEDELYIEAGAGEIVPLTDIARELLTPLFAMR